MANSDAQEIVVEVLEGPAEFSFGQLCNICQVTPELLRILVNEGVVTAEGERPSHWQFAAASVTRVRRARRLRNDLELDFSGLALALDLMEERDRLQAEVNQLRNHLRILMDAMD